MDGWGHSVMSLSKGLGFRVVSKNQNFGLEADMGSAKLGIAWNHISWNMNNTNGIVRALQLLA